MSKITPGLLNDTLNLIQLARETALAQGKETQAKRLSPVVSEMRNLVTSSHAPAANGVGTNQQVATAGARGSSAITGNTANTGTAPVTGVTPTTGVMAQSDFRLLLEATKAPGASVAKNTSPTERSQMVAAMAAGNMNELDIARQLGMTRDEVRLILSVAQKMKSTPESFR